VRICYSLNRSRISSHLCNMATDYCDRNIPSLDPILSQLSLVHKPQILLLVVRPTLNLPSAPAKEVLLFMFETVLLIPRIPLSSPVWHTWYHRNCACHKEVPAPDISSLRSKYVFQNHVFEHKLILPLGPETKFHSHVQQQGKNTYLQNACLYVP
jgi:hypothetical protein